MVSFGNVVVMEFGVELGDNPSVSHGPPIRLAAGEPKSCKTLHLDAYERQQRRLQGARQKLSSSSSNNNPFATAKEELKLSHLEREQLLLNQGYRLHEIVAAAREARQARLRMQTSIGSMHWDSFNEKLEKAKRKFKRAVLRSSEQPLVWDSAELKSKDDSELPPSAPAADAPEAPTACKGQKTFFRRRPKAMIKSLSASNLKSLNSSKAAIDCSLTSAASSTNSSDHFLGGAEFRKPLENNSVATVAA